MRFVLLLALLAQVPDADDRKSLYAMGYIVGKRDLKPLGFTARELAIVEQGLRDAAAVEAHRVGELGAVTILRALRVGAIDDERAPNANSKDRCQKRRRRASARATRHPCALAQGTPHS